VSSAEGIQDEMVRSMLLKLLIRKVKAANLRKRSDFFVIMVGFLDKLNIFYYNEPFP
jgi:hypothetical protein